MSDNSDDGGYMPGESFFLNKNKIIENNEPNINDEQDEQNNNNDYYDDNDTNNKNENYEEHNNENEIEDTRKDAYGDDYDNSDNNYYKDENENNNDYYYQDDYYGLDEYDDEYYNNYKQNNNNYNKYNNYNNNNQKNYYRKGKYNYNRNNYRFYPVTHKSIKSKEFYLTLFEQKFKLWLILVIKFLKEKNETINFFGKIKKNKEEEIDKTTKEKINQEIIDYFINKYKQLCENKKENQENSESNSFVNDIKFKKITSDEYNVEFNLIIKEEMKIYFIKKEIQIQVKGELEYSKYPKFFFNVKLYRLSLTEEGIKIKEKEEEINLESKNEENNEKSEDEDKKEETKKKESENKYTIFEFNNEKDIKNIKSFFIGMQPNYSMKDEKFKKLYLDIKKDLNEDKIDKKGIKGPQEEIRQCIFDLIEILNNDKNY